MSETLSKDASELVRTGRRALRPTDADKARILEAVRSRVAAGETIATEHAPPPVADAPAAGLGVGKIAAALTAGVLAAVAAVVVLTSGRRDTEVAEAAVASVNSAPLVATVEPAETASVAVVTPPVVSEPSSTAASQPVPASPTPSPRGGSSDRLAEEVALLTRAEKEFHAGNYKRALAATEEHRQRFPKGTLVQERVSLRVQALCEMGRGDEAHSEASRFDRPTTASARPKAAGNDVCRTAP